MTWGTAIMNCKHFGDSYDIVKRNLLQRLSPCGKWSVHPMFTDPKPKAKKQPCQRFAGECARTGCGDKTFRRDYRRLFGVHIVNPETFDGSSRRRDAGLSAARDCQDHLFLDPDSGLPFYSSTGYPRIELKSPVAAFLKASELVTIINDRPKNKLTLVFDQSINNDPKCAGSATEQIKARLRWFKEKGIHGFVYRSHANFLLVSKDRDILAYAKAVLLASPKIPKDRLIEIRRY